MFSFTKPHKYVKVDLETITRNLNCIFITFFKAQKYGRKIQLLASLIGLQKRSIHQKHIEICIS